MIYNHDHLLIGEGVPHLRWGIGIAREAQGTEAALHIPHILIAGDPVDIPLFFCGNFTDSQSIVGKIGARAV